MEIFPGLCRWVKEKRPLSAHGIKTAFPDFLFCSVHAPHLALRVQRDLGINCHTKSLGSVKEFSQNGLQALA